MNDTESKQDVTVFWDFETSPSLCSLASISNYEMVKNIRSAVAVYGSLKSIRLYWDFSSHPFPSTALRIRSEFSSSGVSLIDCPAEGRKGAAIKKMLVDMLIHAWDSPLPPTFVVITGDRDAAYALAMLRTKSYRVVLISPAGSHPDLKSQASVQLDWSRTILGINGESNEGGSIFPNGSPDRVPSSAHAPAKSSNSALQSEFPSATLRDTPAPAPALKPSIFSSPYNHGVNVFGGPFFPSPKSSLGLGDPSFPRQQSSIQKPSRSRSGSLTELLRSTSLTNKGKTKASEPEDIELYPHPPTSSRSRLWSSASIFGPFDDDEDDGIPIPRSPPSAPVGPERAASSTSSGSRRSKFSFEQVSKPTEVNTAEPSDGKHARLSNEPQETKVTASPKKETKTKKPTLPPSSPPTLRVLPPPTPKQTPKQKPKVTTPKKATIPKKSPIPYAWMPLVATLRIHNHVLSRSVIAPKLLKYYPDAFQTAGAKNIKTYLEAAIQAGIISMDLTTKKIHLKPYYFS